MASAALSVAFSAACLRPRRTVSRSTCVAGSPACARRARRSPERWSFLTWSLAPRTIRPWAGKAGANSTGRLRPIERLALAGGLALLPAAAPGAVVTVKNTLDLARPSETIVLTGAAIRQAMPVEDLRTVHVTDDATGKELVVQPIDLNDDGVFDEVIFQADIAAGGTRTFTLIVGPRQVHTKDQFKAYGRFVRERRDDFAWENDRVDHRMYGKALETWAQEPLTSSSVDVWFKRTRRLVINDWYMVDDYHRDNGDGADLYSAGRSRGCGGNGINEKGLFYFFGF